MVEGISKEAVDRLPVTGRVGKQILDVITSGMYSDPRMAIREYVQNAADSIDSAIGQGILQSSDARISIHIDGQRRSIAVEDNGTGMHPSDIPAVLVDLGRSRKQRGEQRGFRGIGRLGGLAYCDLLRFESRSSAEQEVGVLEWNGAALQTQIHDSNSQELIDAAIGRTASFYTREAVSQLDSSRFFRVTMVNVRRFHTDSLMHIKSLREYLSQTLPLMYDVNAFTFSRDISAHLEPIRGVSGYHVAINGHPLERPYSNDFEPRAGKRDSIRDIELVELKGTDGRILCRGWYAYTGFHSALPPSVAMRGIRVRQGNIAIGGDEYLRDFYSEPRFASWHIGELHMSSDFKLNARRDGFEESEIYERFLEWTTALCRHLSSLCRQSSASRSNEQHVTRVASELNDLLSVSFYVDEKHFLEWGDQVETALERLRRYIHVSHTPELSKQLEAYRKRLARLKRRPIFLKDALDGRTLRHMSTKEVVQDLCARILGSDNQSHAQRTQVLHQVVSPFLRKRAL